MHETETQHFAARNSAEKLRVRERIKEAVRLRMAGASSELIAMKLGCSRVTAWRYVQKGLALGDKDIQEKVKSMRALELARLDAMQAPLWPYAVGGIVNGKKVEPDAKAVTAVLKIMEQRQKLLGLIGPRNKARKNRLPYPVVFTLLKPEEDFKAP